MIGDEDRFSWVAVISNFYNNYTMNQKKDAPQCIFIETKSLLGAMLLFGSMVKNVPGIMR